MKCWFASIWEQSKASPSESGGREFLSSLSSLSSRPSMYTVRNPANLSTEPVARKLYTLPFPWQVASMFNVVASDLASSIWLASIRDQMRV